MTKEFNRPPQTLRLRPVIAFDDNEIGNCMGLPHLDVLLVFRRPVAGQRGVVVGKSITTLRERLSP